MRSILRQPFCNFIVHTVIAYYYPNLEDSVAHQIEFAQRSCEAEVVHLYFEETQQFIQEQAETLFDERTTTILKMLQQCVPQREIGKAVGVSVSRIGQIAHKAAREIRYAMQRKGFMRQKKVERKCGLSGLTREATAVQLVIFESLLKHLFEGYAVTEFWIDEECCNSVYGAVLAKFCASMSSYGPKAKVVVCIKDEDNKEWDKTIREWVPPYFHTDEFINHVLSKSVEGIRDGRQISYEAFKWLGLPYCNVSEQEKIARILYTLNRRIEKQQEMVDALKKYKRGLIGALISGTLSFAGTNRDSWEMVCLADIFTISAGGDIDRKNSATAPSESYPYPVYANALTDNAQLLA